METKNPLLFIYPTLVVVLVCLPRAGLTGIRQTRGSGTGVGPPGGEEIWSDGNGVPYMEPFKGNITVFAGQTAYLQCVVKHVGDKTVSWIRRRDLHILTSANHVYTNDRRVSLLRQGKLFNAWTLKIENVKKRDEGPYECQVNTEPKLTSSLYLIVFVPEEVGESADSKIKVSGWTASEASQPVQRDGNSGAKYKLSEARILGPRIFRGEGGSVANFTCIISHPGLIAPNVTWFHNDMPIKDKAGWGGRLRIDTKKSIMSTNSQLVIVNLSNGDGGKYSCGGTAVYADSVRLEILPSHLAHMQKEEPLKRKRV